MRTMEKHMFYTILFAVVSDGALGALKCSYGSECLTINDVDKNWWGAEYTQKATAPCFDDWTPGSYVSSTENCLIIQRIYVLLKL